MKYYSLNRILSKHAVYNVIFGERSNGKTYASLCYGLEKYLAGKGQLAYIRRWQDDIIGRRGAAIFSALNENGQVTKATKGKFDCVHYWNGKFYLAKYGTNGKAIWGEEDCLGYLFSLSDTEHNKSASYPNVTTCIYDEFITSKMYLVDEFPAFMNTLSTIIRHRDNVQVFMLGNTVNRHNPYFSEMGLKHAAKMEQGTIDVYTYGDSGLTVAVEYCASLAKKKSNKYFAFDNPKLQMITKGKWQLSLYPHLPRKYNENEISYMFFILYQGDCYQCEVVDFERNGSYNIYIHRKTTPLQDRATDLVFSLDYHADWRFANLLRPTNKVVAKIAQLFQQGKVCYQDNETGNSIENFLMELKRGNR